MKGSKIYKSLKTNIRECKCEQEFLPVSTFLKKVNNCVSDRTIRRLLKSGKLNSYHYDGISKIFIKVSEVVELIRNEAI